MEWLTSLDPTTVCIALIVVGLTLLWAYVMLAGAKREQPNLSVLYEQPSPVRQASGSKKGMKNKAKNKQDESSLKSGSILPKQNRPDSDEEASSNKVEKSKRRSVTPQRPETETKAKSQSKQGRRSRNVAHPQPMQEDGSKQATEDDEGEWQTQLSRQQIRTLRQKQRQEKEASASSDSDSKRPPSSGEEQTKNGSKAKSRSKSTKLEGQATSNKKDKGSAREQQKSSEITTDIEPPKSSSDSDLAEPGKSVTLETSSPELRLPKANDSVGDVEQALQEAAQSNSPSPDSLADVKEKQQEEEGDNNSSSQSPEEPNTKSQEQQTSQSATDSEEWVVL